MKSGFKRSERGAMGVSRDVVDAWLLAQVSGLIVVLWYVGDAVHSAGHEWSRDDVVSGRFSTTCSTPGPGTVSRDGPSAVASTANPFLGHAPAFQDYRCSKHLRFLSLPTPTWVAGVRFFTVACAGAYPRFKKWGEIMASARNEAPRGLSRVCPLPTGGVVWRGGYAPSPEFFSIFELEMASFGAFWDLMLSQ